MECSLRFSRDMVYYLGRVLLPIFIPLIHSLFVPTRGLSNAILCMFVVFLDVCGHVVAILNQNNKYFFLTTRVNIYQHNNAQV